MTIIAISFRPLSSARRPDETVDEGAPVDPTDLVTMAELCAEGFGPDAGPYAPTSREVIAALAAQLDGQVVRDDLGRRCVTRDVARGLFAEREESERRQREVRARRDAELAEQDATNRPWAGIPAGWVPDVVSPASAMLQAAKDAQRRRKSVLEHALADRDGQIEFHPIGPVPE